MDLEKRKAETKSKFDALDKQRLSLLDQAQKILDEQHLLQGEYRLLEQMIAEKKPEKPIEGEVVK